LEIEQFSAVILESFPWLEMPCMVTEPKTKESYNMTNPPASATTQVPELSDIEDSLMTHFDPCPCTHTIWLQGPKVSRNSLLITLQSALPRTQTEAE
jgi:hypothetical protein